MDDIIGIYDDDVKQLLDGIFKLEIKRASYVEPDDRGMGWCFWPCEPFTNVCVEECTKTNGPYPTRQEALDAEVKWLKKVLDKI